MLPFSRRLLIPTALIALASTPLALAQKPSGRLSGQVSDPDGGVIPGATVQVINQDTQAKQQVQSDETGMFTVSGLPPGRYQITVEATGFSPRTSEVITVAAGQTVVFNAKIEVKAEAQTISVEEAGVTAVDVSSASITTTLGSKEVTGYGLNGRNFSSLITMAPGVSNQTGQDEAKVGVAGSAKFSVNGGRVEYNTFEVDGSDVLNTSINASRGQGEPLVVYPSIDAIQDMKVLTADYSAVYGKSASGSVLVTTKSGTDAFHGGAYGFLRNEAFNARNYFDQPDPIPLGYTGKRHYRTPLYRRLDFGGTIGGPVYIPGLYNTTKTRTYFFFSEEIRREKTPVDYNQAVPTIAERAGNFSDVCPTLVPGGSMTFTPSQYPDCPVGVGQAPGRTVAVDYTSAAILNAGLIPEPNSSTGCNSTNPSPLAHCYIASVSPPTHWREELFRIDHNLTGTERLSFRYVHDSWDTVTLAPQWGVVQNSFPTVENRLTGPGLNLAVLLAQTLPSNFLNLISVSYQAEHITLAPQPGVGVQSINRPTLLSNPAGVVGTPVPGTSYCSQVTGSGANATPPTINECAMGYIFNNGFGAGKLPGLVFQGTNGAYGGHGFNADTGYAPWNQANPTFTVRDDASKVVGRHNLQWGFLGTLVQQNEVSAVSGANSGDQQGLLTFSNQQSTYTSGNAFADFLAGSGFTNNGSSPALVLGGIKSYTQDSGQRKYYTRYKVADFYLQDDWRLSPRFTINAGLRASVFGAWYNPKNTAYNWRPESFDSSLNASVFVDPVNGYVVNKYSGVPLPLDRSGNFSGLSSFDPRITNGLTQCGVGRVPNSCLTNKLFHPSPRVGISWDPVGDGKTSIRAGYGLFWEHGTGYEANVGSLIGSAPLVLSETQSNIQGSRGSSITAPAFNAYNRIGFSCQDGATQCGTGSLPGSASFPLNVTSIPRKAVYSYIQQWSISVEHELSKGLVGQLAYVGTKGTHLTAVRDLNQLQPLANGLNPFASGQPITSDVCQSGALNQYFTPGGLNNVNAGSGVTVPTSPGIGPSDPGYVNIVVACTGNPGFVTPTSTKLGLSADVARPYLGFSNIISVDNVADSEYNALQATLRETTGPLTIGLAYTYSHSLDDASDRSSANFANSLDIHSNHATSDFDQKQLLNVNYIYDLPLLRLLDGFVHLAGSGTDAGEGLPAAAVATPWNLGPAWKTLLDRWQLSGITTFQTGTPFSVVNGGGSNGTGASDNAGVGDALGIGSYADVVGKVHAGKPFVAQGGQNVGPLLLNPGAFAAPRGLTFGNSGRNYLRNPSRINFNLSLFKHFKPQERIDVEFRAEAFNVFNHTQFRITDPSNPGNTGNNVINCYGSQTQGYSAGAANCLNGNSFLHPVDAHDPRILQFGIKGNF